MGKSFISKNDILPKMNAALKREHAKKRAQIAAYKRELKKRPYVQSYIERLQKEIDMGFKGLYGIPFKSRLLEFRGPSSQHRNGGHFADATHEFSTETGEARSYDWYVMGKLIGKTYVVNSYYFSSNTSGHVSDLKATLKVFGVKFVELEAPRGLQNLSESKAHYLTRMGEAIVSNKYALKKHSIASLLRETEASLALLSKLGVKTSKAERAKAVARAEAARDSRLAQAKSDREALVVDAFEAAQRAQDLKTIVALIPKMQKLGKLPKDHELESVETVMPAQTETPNMNAVA